MSKFFLKPPKPMFSSKDYRIVSFIQIHNSLKKFKQFQTKRIIKALKIATTKQLETQLEIHKNIPSNTLSTLTIELPKYQTFLHKQISTSVQDAMSSIQSELSKQQQIFDFFNKYQKSSLYAKAKQASLLLKQRQNKRVKTLSKRSQKKNQQTQDKVINNSKIKNRQPKRFESRKKTHNDSKQEVSIRYSNKPVNLTQLKPKFQSNSKQIKEQRPKQMHPSWAAKKQQQIVAVFSGTKKSLI